jgi:hypothetical protein
MRVAAGNRHRQGLAHGAASHRAFPSSGLRLVAANDNPPLHARWRRLVAASLAGLFLLALVLAGAICTARAAERAAPYPAHPATLIMPPRS